MHMKSTKEIISVLKYQGFMTSTSDTQIFLDAYDTVEELGDAGFIGDRGAIDFLRNIFDENGVNMTGPTTDEDVEKAVAEETKEEVKEEVKEEPVVGELEELKEEVINTEPAPTPTEEVKEEVINTEPAPTPATEPEPVVEEHKDEAKEEQSTKKQGKKKK